MEIPEGLKVYCTYVLARSCTVDLTITSVSVTKNVATKSQYQNAAKKKKNNKERKIRFSEQIRALIISATFSF